MTQSYLQFQVDQLRQTKIILAVETVAVLLFSLFGTALLPQLLIQFLLSNQGQFVQPPVWLQYIPVVFFALGAGYFVYAVISMVMTKLKIDKLEKELAGIISSCSCQDMCGCTGHDQCGCEPTSSADLAEMMAAAEKVVTRAEKKTASKKTTKKSVKK